MFNKASRTPKAVLSISLLFVLSFLSMPALAKGGGGEAPPPVVVVGHDAQGSNVLVKVQNLSKQTMTVTVVVEATVGSMNVRGCTHVLVFGGGTAETVVGFAGLVEDVDTVSIIDDSHPQ